MLIETHMVVHTKGGKIWTTLESPLDDHYELLKRCDFHHRFGATKEPTSYCGFYGKM